MKKLFLFLMGLIAITLFITTSCKKENSTDTTCPIIEIKGSNPAIVGQGTIYIDAGAAAYDDTDGDISSLIISTNNVNTTDTGIYWVTYNVSDIAGNQAAEQNRTVKVIFMK